MTRRAPRHIDWAEVASRAKADVGSEGVERVSARLRATVLVVHSPPDRDEFEDFRLGATLRTDDA